MFTLSLNPTYLCNFRCDFCYLTKDQLSDKKRLPLSDLRELLIELERNDVKVGHVDLYGGEIALLPEEYLSELNECLLSLNGATINVITNLSLIPDFFLKDHVDLSVSFDFEGRQDYEKVLHNIVSLKKDVSVLMLASPQVMNKDVEEMIRLFNTIQNIKSVEIKPYSTNQANELETSFSDFEAFIFKWLNSKTEKLFEFINEKYIFSAARKERNAFSDDHVYITPAGKFGVLDFDENDKEFFLELESFQEYDEWRKKEKSRVKANSFCSRCEFYGSCLTEHYRDVKDLKNSCNGFYNLIVWGKRKIGLMR